MTGQTTEIVFWVALTLIGYTFAGYPLLVACLDAVRTQIRRPTPAAFASPTPNHPTVSVVLCVFNEEERIGARLQNLFETDYPPDRLEIIVVSDGSTDQTTARASAFPDARVRVLGEPARRGKAFCLNRALETATGDIVVFADSRQRFEPGAIRRLVSNFADSHIGAVSGCLEIETAASITGKGIDFYWQLEKRVRQCESSLGTTIGCTGAIYAIRKHLFRPLPPDTLLDDVVVPMTILTAGHRVVFEPGAVASDPQPLEPSAERTRKIRTMAGNYQIFFRYPQWLSPWKNRAWWQLLSHKYLRLAAPWLLLLVLLANIALAQHAFYRMTLVIQAGLYATALTGLLFPKVQLRIVSLPSGFLFLNLMAMAGLFSYLRKSSTNGWKTTSRSRY